MTTAPKTMAEAVQAKMDETARYFVSLVLAGKSYTYAWESIQRDTCFRGDLLRMLSNHCVEAANAAVKVHTPNTVKGN